MVRLKVLIIGRYGTFGGRLAKLLADEYRLILLIAGRSMPPPRSAPGSPQRPLSFQHVSIGGATSAID